MVVLVVDILAILTQDILDRKRIDGIGGGCTRGVRGEEMWGVDLRAKNKEKYQSKALQVEKTRGNSFELYQL